MQKIIIEKPYKFSPRHRGKLLPGFIRNFNLFTVYLKRSGGIVDYEIRNLERFQKSLDAGHAILITPNHCRAADPVVMGWLTKEADCFVYAMASWHLYHKSRFDAFAIRAMGGFSVNREGLDRQAIHTAIEVLETAERPLIVFPEGATSRMNDRLQATMEGISFIAHTAAKKRAKRCGGKVVVHPVGMKYLFGGDLRAAVEPVLRRIEQRLSWQPQDKLPLVQRIKKVGLGLLSLKEIEYFGEVRPTPLAERLEGLIRRILAPIEEEWLGREQTGGVVPRVKALRMKIAPDLIRGGVLSDEESQRRWSQIADTYLAHQISCFPADYLDERPSVDRLLETVEKYEEGLTDKVTVHGHLKVILQIDEPIEVPATRDRTAAIDPLMSQIETRLQTMLDELALESPLYEDPS